MPATPQSTDDVQVAASNQTLNAFLGGRRPSWYQNTKSTAGLKPRKSTIRSVSQSKPAENRVRKTPVTENGDGVNDVAPEDQIASQKHDQQLATAVPRDRSLLPSPALTNEPSPALSTRHASPTEQTGSFSFQTEDRNTEAELRTLQQSPAASHPSPATTEAPQPVDVGMVHIEHGPKPRPTQATSEPVSSQAGSPTAQSAGVALASTSSPDPQTPTTPVSGSTSSAAPRTINARPSSLRKKRARPSSTSANNRAPQRPRTDMSHEQGANIDHIGQWQQYCQRLDDRITASGGWANLGSGIESPRFKYLRDALVAGDGFYVLLHQLLCLWSLDANRAYGVFPNLVRTTVDQGFSFLMNILRPNSLLAYNSLLWFADFPKPVSGDGILAIPSLAPRIGTFLIAFVQRWDRMLAQARTRKYPLTAFELGPTLTCDSRILQGTFFTVSRRVVGIRDSVAGQLNAVFCKDQEDEAHLREIGAPADLLQKYRQERVRHYSELARQAKRADPSRSPSVSESVQPQRAQTFPTASAPPTPTSGSPAQPGQMLPSQLIAPNIAMPIPSLPRSNSIPTGVPLHVLQAQQQAAGQHPNTITQMNHLQPSSQPASPQTSTSPISVSMAPLPSPTHPQATQVMSYPSPRYHQQHFQPAVQHAPQFQQPYQFPQHYQPQQAHPQQAQHLMPSQRIPHQPQAHPQHVLPNQQIPYALQIPQSQHGRPVQQAHESRHPAPSIAQPGQSQPGVLHMPNNIPQNAANSRTVSANGVANAGGVQHQNLQIAAQRVRRIPEHEYPSSPYDWLSHASAAHLSTLRSPERRAARQLPPLVRYYQHISDFALGPMKFPPQTGPRNLGFTVSSSHLARIPLAFENEVGLPVRYYGDGSLRYRLRLCMRPESESMVSPSDWVVSPTHWPQAIFPALNGQPLMVRRKQHFHHDLPVDLSDLVVKGDNVVRISFPDKPVNYKKGMTYFVAIEIVSTMSHDALTSLVLEAPPISAEETRAEIQRRLKPSESDDVVVEDNTFYINVADPFSSSLFEVPVRGVLCRHLDCFDLETWLQTRQGKPGGGLEEPSMADNWKCPICFLDARPSSLRVDEFFAEVRKGLLAQNLGKTKKILVSADGSWSAVPELDDSEDESPIQPNRSLGERINQKKATAPVNIIEIDDD